MNNPLQNDGSFPDDSNDLIVDQSLTDDPRNITPNTESATKHSGDVLGLNPPLTVKKELFGWFGVISFVTPAKEKLDSSTDDINVLDESRKRPRLAESPAKQRLYFGKAATPIAINRNVQEVYKIVRKRTGAIGGNGSFGPIYGELTAGSMQKMVNLMKEYSGLDSTSLFLDIGSGIGKPNLHVSQDPGVNLSLGIESEQSRWILSMNCLQGVVDTILNHRCETAQDKLNQDNCDLLECNCLYILEDVLNVHTFDPFTHVYMFSIGFPPCLWIHLSKVWNSCEAPYLICYHGPRYILDDYSFDAEFISQTSTRMNGSKECHTGYLYKRIRNEKKTYRALQRSTQTHWDPSFVHAINTIRKGAPELRTEIELKIKDAFDNPLTRSGVYRIKKNDACTPKGNAK